MVQVPAVEELLVFEMVRSFVVPVALTLPSMVTLSAPFKSRRGAATFPLMERPLEVGYIVRVVQVPAFSA